MRGQAAAATRATATEADTRFRVLNWIGIINQLSSTLANHMLEPLDLPLPQFTLLNHFGHRPKEGKTITGIARAMQQLQPGISKTVQKLIAKGYLEWRPNPEDGRSKLLFLTPAGRRVHAGAVAMIGEALAGPFEGWTQTELEDLFAQLDRLKVWFDDNRPG